MRNTLQIFTCVLIAGAIYVTVCQAEDRVVTTWPFLRGANFDGHAPPGKIVESFPDEGPPVLWTRPLGAGYSGFTAKDNRVFTQYQTLGGQYVLCLNAETGETFWEYRYEGPYDPAGLYPGPRATPTLGKDRVYFSAPSGLVGCLTQKTGRLVWSLNVFDHFQVEPVEFAYSCSPVLVDGKLLLPVGQPNATMVALDAETGRVLWQSGDEPISHVPAMPITWNGRQLAIGYLRNSMMAFDVATGEILWKKSLSSGYDEHAAWPIYREPYLWISSPFRGGSELIELIDEKPGYRTVWKSSLMSNDVCSSVLIEEAIYGFDLRDVQAKPHRPSRGQFRCMDFLTGESHWTQGQLNQRRTLDDEFDSIDSPVGQASVLFADGKLILWNDVGELILAKAGTTSYEELARTRVLGGEICWTQPTLVRGRLYVRNHSRAACVLLASPDDPNYPHDTPTLTVAEIPQSAYTDWAAWLLPIEPEYAMDAPTIPQLTRWFIVSLWGFAFGAVLGCGGLIWDIRQDRKHPEGTASRMGTRSFLLSVFVLGAMGTTLLSRHLAEFVFSWPMCLFAVFAATIYQTRQGPDSAHSSWRGRLWLVMFLAICLGYFWLCRRLSLAFEWVFLAGFPAAVPFLLFARRFAASGWISRVIEWAFLTLAFAAYYWASSALLIWKYGLIEL